MRELRDNGFKNVVDQIEQSELDRLKDYGYLDFNSYAKQIDHDI